jgi:hypothetical protein
MVICLKYFPDLSQVVMDFRYGRILKATRRTLAGEQSSSRA